MLSMFGKQQPALEAKEKPPLPAKIAHIVVLGNEKGGSGKTTTCMHLIVSLLRLGYRVGSMDIDSRQRSLSRYLENRKATMDREGITLPMPNHVVVQKSPLPVQREAEQDEAERFLKALFKLQAHHDFVVVDSPGNDTFMSRLAHSFSDTIITPINDSFVDLDVLANVDGATGKIVKPSIYAEMVWEQKLKRAKRDTNAIDWIVMRNRLSNLNAKNKQQMMNVVNELAGRIGFRVAPGFSERVIFRELFLQGLTVLDIMETGGAISMSHIAARQEVRDLLRVLNIAQLNEKIQQVETAENRDDEESSADADNPAPSAVDDITSNSMPVNKEVASSPIPSGATREHDVVKQAEVA